MNNSLKKPLKRQLKTKIQSIQLDNGQLSTLEQLIKNADVSTQGANRRWYSLAAAGVLLIAVLTTILMSQLSDNRADNMAQQIAEEVVSNHLKLKPLEVKTGSISAVRGYFTKLNFMPVASRLPALENLELIGGRYCSLQGITAAQLRMKQGDNVQTLYQTEYLPEIFGDLPHIEKDEAPLVVYAKGIKVKIWVEKGLLLAVTDSPEIDTVEESAQ